MTFTSHLLRLVTGPNRSAGETIHLATRTDVRSGAPIFRAPALPTPSQLNRELPFTSDFRPRFGTRR